MALRAAARVTEERFLVGVADDGERSRLLSAFKVEGPVVEVTTTTGALERLAAESFDIAVLDGHALAAARERRPFSDLVLITSDGPSGAADLFAREAAAVLPRPLPASDALLRAHVRWLASCRRSRARGLLIANAATHNRQALRDLEPALDTALADITAEGGRDAAVLVIGDAELAKVVGGSAAENAPDAVVVAVAASEAITPRLQEARQRAAGAAFVVVDGAATPARLAEALYGGARAYVDRRELLLLPRVVATIAQRRRAEVIGRRLVETLARFGVLGDAEQPPPAVRDLDPRMIAQATSGEHPVVPSAHEVLVVDDEVVVLTVLREALRRGGYRVTTAASAEEAIDLMRRRVFDLVLTDKNLPGASGLEVLRVARTLDPAPAVVLITGYSSYDSAVDAKDLGAHDYIEKPINDVENLRFRIRRALSRRDEQMARAANATPAPTARRGHVLLVEVDGDRRRVITEFLGRTYDVTAVADGDEALAVIQKGGYDVVLADRNLPGMSGLRVIEQARRLLPHCASVLYTAYPSFDSIKDAFELGVDAYLVRPSEDLRKLGEKVAGALASRGGILLG